MSRELPSELPLIIGVDVIERLARYDRSTFAADYAIGNQPWLSAASPENPISRLTTQYQKERVDQEASAGENSLSNWWLRSATSWHHGEGAEFYDGDDQDQWKFFESANVDVWTQGKVSLLPDTTAHAANHGGTTAVTCALGVWFLNDGALYLYKSSDDTVTEITALTATCQSLATDGAEAIVGCDDGIYEVAENLTVTKLYDPPTGSTTWTVQAIAFVKSRIMVGCQITDAEPMRVFELERNPTTPPRVVNKSVTTGDSRYEYASTSLSFAAITETSGALLVATNTGAQGRVLSFTVDTSAGGLGTLKDPINVAEFPVGETINTFKSYLNSFVVIATNKGVRVGTETSNGVGFTYGPISIEDSVSSIAFKGEFVYATRSVERAGQYGLWRLDLGTQEANVYAYAADLSVADGVPTAVAFIGTTGRALILTGDNVYTQHATRLAPEGYINSGKIRYGTTEFKQPVSFSIRSTGTYGVLGVSVTSASGDVVAFDSIPLAQQMNIPLSAELLPEAEFTIEVQFTRDAIDDTAGPVLDEWQLRSLPAPLRSRTITIPLMCYEQERDANGVSRVADPWQRLRALESLEQSGGACLLQDFSTGEERICVVRAVQFQQNAAPSFANGFGGVVTVQLQTVDVEVV